jgi:hypothetical protein
MTQVINGVDWSDLEHKWSINVYQLDPADMSSMWGRLEGVDLSTCSISEGYYTDTRVQGQLSYYDAERNRQAFIQIRATVPNVHTEILGTFLVTNDDVSYEGGSLKTTLNLESMLYALDVQAMKAPWVVKKGTSFSTFANQILNTCHRPWRNCSMRGYTYGSAVSYSTGTSYLSALYDACSTSNNRLDVDGRGNVTIEPYILPKKRTPIFNINLNDVTGIAHDGVTRSSDYLELPTDCVVYYNRDSDNVTDCVRGYASNGGRYSFGQRGYVVTKVVSVSEEPKGGATALANKAKTLLANASVENVTWEVTTEYMPVHAGDVGYLQGMTLDISPYNTRQLVMVKNVELELEHMTMKLTLKSANSNDEEEE